MNILQTNSTLKMKANLIQVFTLLSLGLVLPVPGDDVPQVCDCCEQLGMGCSADGYHCVRGEGEEEPKQKLVKLEVKDEQCEGTNCPGGCCPEKCWYCCPEWYCAATAADCVYSAGFF